jgi:4'-phosphopantetheinyl transferase
VVTSKTEIEIGPAWDATSIASPDSPAPGVVHLWRRALHASAAEVNSCYGLLSNEEKERATGFRIERPRKDFVLTRGTLRLLLARYLGSAPEHVRLGSAANGKPFLEGEPDLCFNVSHTDGLALLGFAKRRAIGVDVENLEREIEAELLAERFFSERERQALRRFNGDELRAAFFRCWTRKEAYIKAKGDGLSLPLDQFDVSVAANDEDALLATRSDPDEAARWTICDVPIGPGYAAAVAVAQCETVSPG